MTQGKRLRLKRLDKKVLKKDLAKKDKKDKIWRKNECKALQIFKIWYTRNKLSANVFFKNKSLKQYKEVE